MSEVEIKRYVEEVRSATIWSSKCVNSFVLTSNVARAIMLDMIKLMKTEEMSSSVEYKALQARIPAELKEYYLVTAYRQTSKNAHFAN